MIPSINRAYGSGNVKSHDQEAWIEVFDQGQSVERAELDYKSFLWGRFRGTAENLRRRW